MTVCTRIGSISLIFAALSLAACGGGGGASRPPTYTIGGMLSGLAAGQQVVLQDNQTDSLTLSADGAFTFKNAVAANGGYSVASPRSRRGRPARSQTPPVQSPWLM